MTVTPVPAIAFITYTVVDFATSPPTPIAVKMSRRECKDYKDSLRQSGADVSQMRIRRGRNRLFER